MNHDYLRSLACAALVALAFGAYFWKDIVATHLPALQRRLNDRRIARITAEVLQRFPAQEIIASTTEHNGCYVQTNRCDNDWHVIVMRLPEFTAHQSQQPYWPPFMDVLRALTCDRRWRLIGYTYETRLQELRDVTVAVLQESSRQVKTSRVPVTA